MLEPLLLLSLSSVKGREDKGKGLLMYTYCRILVSRTDHVVCEYPLVFKKKRLLLLLLLSVLPSLGNHSVLKQSPSNVVDEREPRRTE